MTDKQRNPTDTRVSRRGLFRGLALGGVAVGGGVVGALAFGGSGSAYNKQSLSVDVACLGVLWREGVKANPADDADSRAPFLVEGWIYPAGYIKGDGFIPTEEGSIGRWFCRGYTLTDANRTAPHVLSHQDFVFGKIEEKRLFPPDTISVVGLEGSLDKAQSATRAIVGGTGKYMGATGQALERWTFNNTSKLPVADFAFCFRFDFEMRVLD